MLPIPDHIVMVHNRYQYSGGEDVSTQAEIAMLKAAGHQVTYIEEDNQRINNFTTPEKLNLFLTTPWNSVQAKKFQSLLKNLQPDIFHVQNFFPLFSPSIHSAAKSLDIPTIQHLRNFRLGCLNGYLYREESICEACVNHNPWRGVVYRCYRDSFPASLGLWNLISFNRWRKTWLNDVDKFISPSRFATQKLIEIGIPSNCLYTKPNVTPDPLLNQPLPPLPPIPTFLYLGRFSPEKGVHILLEAWKRLNQPQWQLNLLGDGPLRPSLETFVKESGLLNVNFLGHQDKFAVIEAIKQATIIVVPSQWYETFGRVVIEAFACGRGVLVSDLGALSELVAEGNNGFLVKHNQIEVWVDRLNWCGNNISKIEQIGVQGRKIYLAKYTPEINYQQMMEIYRK